MPEITSSPNQQKPSAPEQNPIQSASVENPTVKEMGNKKKILLVLISFIVILALAAGLFYFYQLQNVNKRDSQRKTDIAAIQAALEKYSRDTQEQKYYPSAITPTTLEKRAYIEKIPQDPKNTSPYLYVYRGLPSGCTIDCTGYTLTACLENKNAKGQNTIDPVPSCETRSYIVSIP